MSDEPRRRDADRERRRWNDQALDQLARRVEINTERVDDVENEHEALAGLIATVDGMDKRLDQMWEAMRDAAGLEERRVGSLRGELGELRADVKRCTDAVAEGFGAVRLERRGVDWKTVLAVASTIAVPIMVALIAVLKG